jgi:DNA-directed RNA polymerase beta subunit
MAHHAQARGPYVPEEYEELVAPHVQSFDWFLTEGLQSVVDSLEPVEVCGALGVMGLCAVFRIVLRS